MIEKFSEVLNMQHHFSIFLLIDVFYLVILSSLNLSMNKDFLFVLIINFENAADFELTLYKEAVSKTAKFDFNTGII